MDTYIWLQDAVANPSGIYRVLTYVSLFLVVALILGAGPLMRWAGEISCSWSWKRKKKKK